ncbi:hypothetical protein WR25_00797 [Diploscapter pachys]|uniref:Coenzyme Q-binding protein COQ10 START domain-containing protein n=1 Tax=Diploscapter pachys TaxID=2018661 RepID=A0A2A2JKH6_9BILA|nr:hypothetical protein WR25_00797 [Diploscapter pachys]
MEYEEKRIIGYSRQRMFDVVADVAEYKHFIPWCRDSTVFDSKDNTKLAKLSIGFPPIMESYTSRVIMLRPSIVKSTVICDSLFKTLETSFIFSEGKQPDTCHLHYHLQFEFKSSLHAQFAHLFFDKVVKAMVGAFLNRAEELHGKPTIPHEKPQILHYQS